ncbi:hypothetical protein [Streptomyces sp. AK010]|uniref:hypothetical protein n=1 Tax=Streptomyces sp. AK010 TaxID=2723074 RepID=UPI00160CC855|nr:hypothetical protein [Streptomyces sp. AK010]MBB6420427.1 ketosteroid isomerase-like protein [Streptomyces sp. AK010]
MGSTQTLFAEDIVWQQPGGNQFSGTHRGAATVREVMGRVWPFSVVQEDEDAFWNGN